MPGVADSEIGLTSASRTISGGMPTYASKGEIMPIIASRAPELRKIEIETLIPARNGSKLNAILIPSFPHSTNVSYVGTFFHVAVASTINRKHGINQTLNTVTTPIFSSPGYVYNDKNDLSK